MSKSITVAPQMVLYREAVAAADTLPEIRETAGLNCGHYEFANINVIPSGGANPTVAVLYWSDKAGKFIQENPALTKAGVGADTPFAFTVPTYGRRIFVAVTVLAAGQVDIEASGYSLNHTL